MIKIIYEYLHSIPLESLSVLFCQKNIDAGFHTLKVKQFALWAAICELASYERSKAEEEGDFRLSHVQNKPAERQTCCSLTTQG